MSEDARAAGTGSGELSAEDAERMAAEFRPAWELDDAPFAAPAAPMTESTVDALAKTSLNGSVGHAGQIGHVGQVAQAIAAAPAEGFVPPPPRTPSFDPPAQLPGISAGTQPQAQPAPQMNKTLMGMISPVGVPVSPEGAPPPPPAGVNPPNASQSPQNHGQQHPHFGSTVVMGMTAPAVLQNFPEPERPIIRSERPPAIEVGVSARSQSGRPPPRPANARPIVDTMPTADRSADYAVPRKSNLGMIAGITVGALAIIGVIVAIKFATDTPHPSTTSSMSGSSNASSSTNTAGGNSTSAAQARKDDIPPPPVKDDTTVDTTTKLADKPPVLSQDIPVMKPAALPTAQATHQAVAVAPVAAATQPPRQTYQAPVQHATSYQPPATTTAKPPATKPQNGGGIVRDAPF